MSMAADAFALTSETWVSCSLDALGRGGRHSDKITFRLPSAHRIGGRSGMEPKMTKLITLCAAVALFAPIAYAALSQASQMLA